MAIITLVSGKSCGVTCSALALALSSPRPSLLVEADPAGGTIRTGYLQGAGSARRGMHRLAAADRQGTLAEEFEHHFVPLDQGGRGDRMLLPGLTDPSQAPSLARTWDSVATLLQVMEQSGYDVIIDAGRIVPESANRLSSTVYPAALLRRADLVLCVVRSTLTSLVASAPAVHIVREDLTHHGTGADALGLLLIEQGGYTSSHVTQQMGAPVIASLAYDPDSAHVLTHGGPGRKTTHQLHRTARSAHGPIGEVVGRRRVQLYPAGFPTQPIGSEEEVFYG